jgi:hypothetical protein
MIEISGKNYRVVHIRTGEHAGKATARNPERHRTWRVIGQQAPITLRKP